MMIVELIKGNIVEQQTDVIVNTTSPALTLSVGYVSSAILQAAGPQLQTECHTKYPRGINYTDVATTKGGNLQCTSVYHVALQNTWYSDNTTTLQNLQDVIKLCLQTANKEGHKSISFPLLGAGQLQYPCDTVINLITNAANSFKGKSLRKVTIVEQAAVQGTKRVSVDSTAETETKRLKPDPSPSCSSDNSTIPNHTPVTESNTVQKICTDGTPKGNAQPSPIKIEMITGNVIHQKVDVIVISADTDLSFERENMKREIARVGGSSIQEECKKKYPNGLKSWGIGFTGSGNLECREILHVCLPPFANDPVCEKLFKAAMYLCMGHACKHGHKSIAFPMIGSGALKYPADTVATWLLESVQKCEETMTSRTLEEVQIVVLPAHVPRFEQPDCTVNLTLEIGHIASVRTNVTHDVACTHDWSVFVRSSDGTAKIENVIEKVVFKLHDTFIEPKITITTPPYELHRSGYGGFLLPIEIYCLQDDVPKKTIHYAMYLNHQGEPSVNHTQQETLTFQNPKSELKRKLLEAGGVVEQKEDTSSTSVIHGIESPKNWDHMGPSDFCKLVPLLSFEEEFKEVAKNFADSMGRHNIVAIERIQNRTLYLQYHAMKRQFEARNPGWPNELTLWHGTNVEATTSINMHGFNRSYCGKNATCLGKGVYFARQSSYSAQETYSPKDAYGHKRMYQAKVLTGQYTRGKSSFNVPPAKDVNRPHDRYDCVVDNESGPNMFVIFQDAQAYPSYLITFV